MSLPVTTPIPWIERPHLTARPGSAPTRKMNAPRDCFAADPPRSAPRPTRYARFARPRAVRHPIGNPRHRLLQTPRFTP